MVTNKHHISESNMYSTFHPSFLLQKTFHAWSLSLQTPPIIYSNFSCFFSVSVFFLVSLMFQYGELRHFDVSFVVPVVCQLYRTTWLSDVLLVDSCKTLSIFISSPGIPNPVIELMHLLNWQTDFTTVSPGVL